MRMNLRGLVSRARHRRIQRREHAIRILAINPDMPIEMRLEHVRLVECRARVVGHRIVRHAMERWSLCVARRTPRVGKHQVLDGDELERPVRLVARKSKCSAAGSPYAYPCR